MLLKLLKKTAKMHRLKDVPKRSEIRAIDPSPPKICEKKVLFNIFIQITFKILPKFTGIILSIQTNGIG